MSEVLSAFSGKNSKVLKYLRKIKYEDLEQLKDYLNEYDEGGVSTQTILDLISLWEYIIEINKINANEKPANFVELTKFIENSLKEERF